MGHIRAETRVKPNAWTYVLDFLAVIIRKRHHMLQGHESRGFAGCCVVTPIGWGRGRYGSLSIFGVSYTMEYRCRVCRICRVCICRELKMRREASQRWMSWGRYSGADGFGASHLEVDLEARFGSAIMPTGRWHGNVCGLIWPLGSMLCVEVRRVMPDLLSHRKEAV